MSGEYKRCTRCVMDTTDPEIRFDAAGVCNHCHTYDALVRDHVFTGAEAQVHLERLVAEIHREGADRDYDCVIGVSGGVDSSFVAYTVKRLGLRPIAVHLDNGWNSELAVRNVENVLRVLGIDLHTHVLDWEEFRDLQLAFLKASTPDCEIPTDHAIAAVLRQTAERFGVRHIISGANVRTETHLPRAWSQGHNDWRYIRSVHRRFGSVPLRSFPHSVLLTALRSARRIRWLDILNHVDYRKAEALDVLKREVGWQDYGGKHHESIYTRFYQGYILPVKFGFDKRKSHLSSLICSGEITRAAALAELQEESYSRKLQEEDRVYVAKKLGITVDAFNEIMRQPPRSYWDFPSYGRLSRSWAYRAARTSWRLAFGRRVRLPGTLSN